MGSEAALDEAAAARAAARSRVAAARARLARARRDLAEARLRAPWDGRVAVRLVEPSERVAPGEPVLEIQAQHGGLELVVSAPETVVEAIARHERHAIRGPAVPGRAFAGRVSDVGARARGGAGFPVEIAIAPPAAGLRPGMSAEVTLKLSAGAAAESVAIPVTAYLPGPDGTAWAFVVDRANGTVERRAIALGGLIGRAVLVTDGLAPGETIVTKGLGFLRKGQKVSLLGEGPRRFTSCRPSSSSSSSSSSSASASWVVAMTVTPLLAHRFIRAERNDDGTPKRGLFERAFEPVSRIYERLLRAILRRRWLFLAAMGAALAAGVAGVATAPQKFFPPNKGFVLVDVRHFESVAPTIETLRAVLRAEFPDVSARVASMFLGPTDSSVIEVQVKGPDADFIVETAARVEELLLENVPGVIDVRDDWENRVSRLVVAVDQDRARRAGVTSADVARIMNAHFSGATVSRFREGDDTVPIVARASGEARSDLGRVRSLTVYDADGNPVPLSQMADVALETGFFRIAREGMMRTPR